MATVVYLFDGTDATQDVKFVTPATGGSSTVTSATDQSHTGPRSLKLTMVDSSVNVIFPAGTLADAGRAVSFWFRVDSAAWSGTNQGFFRLETTGGLAVAIIGFQTGTSKIFILPVGATQANGGTSLSADTWYRFTVSYTVTNTTTFRFDLYLNGVIEASATAGTLTRTGSNRVQFQLNTAIGGTKSIWFDDLYIDDRSDYTDPGTTSVNSLRVTNKRPVSNGTTNGFSTQIGSGGSGYGSGHSPQVNEQPLSTTNGWSMIGAGSAVTEEYTIEGASVGDVDISSGYSIVDYMGWLYASSLASETGLIKVGGNTSNISLTSTNTIFTAVRGSTTYPAGGTDIGIVTDTTLTTVSLYEAGVLFAVEPVAGGQPTQRRWGGVPFMGTGRPKGRTW